MTEEDNRYGSTQSQPPGDRGAPRSRRPPGRGWCSGRAQDADGIRRERRRRPSLQATAVSPQPTSTSPQPTPTSRPLRFFPVAPVFVNYYALVDGPADDGPGHLPPADGQRRPGPVLREGPPGGPAGHQHHRQPGLRLRVRAAGGRDEGHQQPPPRRAASAPTSPTPPSTSSRPSNLRVPVPPGFQSGERGHQRRTAPPSSPSPPTSPPPRATTCPPSSGST